MLKPLGDRVVLKVEEEKAESAEVETETTEVK